MQSEKLIQEIAIPPFNLHRFLKTVFDPKKGEKLAILIDLENPEELKDFDFLNKNGHEAQKKAYEIFYQGLKRGEMQAFELESVDFFAYQMTGGSNLELPSTVVSSQGEVLKLTDVYTKYEIILCIGAFSATAPLTLAAKEYDFRGATIPGLNDIVLNTGLATDYNQVCQCTEKMRQGMTGADSADVDFEVGSAKFHLHFYLGDQVAQKNDGICHECKHVVNLPAGKVYFIPYDAEGSFPMKFDDGTLAALTVSKGRIKKVNLISGDQKKVDELQGKIDNDKAVGIIGELGFGTQIIPHSGCNVQDGKVFGTFHFGIGRNDHLHGSVTLSRFIDIKNATHEDILFSQEKTPEIKVVRFSIKRNGKEELVIENDEPKEYLKSLLS